MWNSLGVNFMYNTQIYHVEDSEKKKIKYIKPNLVHEIEPKAIERFLESAAKLMQH